MNKDMNGTGMFYGAPPYIFEKARELRQNMTEVEQVLWERLKKKQVNDCKFRRQHPLSEFIADFYCHSAKLVVELDGSYHNLRERKIADKERTNIMNKFGIKVLRFYNNQVMKNIDDVTKVIRNNLEKRAS